MRSAGGLDGFDVVVDGQHADRADPARLRRGGRDLVARDRPRQARELRGDARARAARAAAASGRARPSTAAEERMPPRRLGERTPVARERRQAGLARARGGSGRRARTTARAPRSRRAPCDAERTGLAPVRRRTTSQARPNSGAVARVHRQTDRPPVPPRDGLAEERRVRVVAAEDLPVERFCAAQTSAAVAPAAAARVSTAPILTRAGRRCTPSRRAPPAAARRRAGRGRDAEPARAGRRDRRAARRPPPALGRGGRQEPAAHLRGRLSSCAATCG